MRPSKSETQLAGSRRLIDVNGVRKTIGGDPLVDRSTVHRWVQRGWLPPPIKIGERVARWVQDEIDAAIQRRADIRGRKAPPRRDA